MLSPYIDIHTHQIPKKGTGICIYNHVLGKDKASLPDGVDLFSAGIHPWYIETYNLRMDELESLIHMKNCLAVGECGLDALKGSEINRQEELFVKQISLSESIGKPLIIHCVKAFDALLRLHKLHKPEMPWVIHGFQGNSMLMSQLIEKGFYLSFGAGIINDKRTTLRTCLQNIPTHCLFLETDDWAGDISDIYKQAAEIRNISVDELKESVYGNFKKLFRK